jgi:hypothetical protein
VHMLVAHLNRNEFRKPDHPSYQNLALTQWVL